MRKVKQRAQEAQALIERGSRCVDREQRRRKSSASGQLKCGRTARSIA